jgi:membrane associated rhomboid family serine protease
MGIYDRDYYRKETEHSLWVTGLAPLTAALVGTNVVVFLLGVLSPGADGLRGVLALESGSHIFQRYEIWRLVTCGFFHEDVWHLGWNMVCLWWFGRELEMLYGSREYGVFYFTATTVASLAAALAGCWSDSAAALVGASPVVAAVLLLYAMYYPRQPIHFFGLFPIEMRWFVGLYIAADMFMLMRLGIRMGTLDQVAHLAAVVYTLAYKWVDLRVSFRFSYRVQKSTPHRETTAREPESPEPPSGGAGLDGQLEGELDRVLAKLHREGRASLSREEEAVLQQASHKLRQRR